jgi:hydrogenase expression/formation protein HypE
MGVILQQERVPVRDPVQSVCDMLGYDPLYLACEGRVVAVVDTAHADTLLQCWHSLPEGCAAACIGHVSAAHRHVVLQTGLGGERLLEELEDDPLPRIC